MNNLEALITAIKGLQANKLRAFLTMLGIIFGVAAVIAMMSIGEGAKQETLQQIELMGTNNIIINKIVPEEQTQTTKAFSPGLSLKDADAIKDVNPFVEFVTPIKLVDADVFYKNNVSQLKIVGTTPNYPLTFNSKLSSGSFFKTVHNESFSNVCVIGDGIRKKMFKFEEPIGKKLKIGDQWFDIVGVVSPKSASGAKGLSLRNFNEDIYVPINTAMFKIMPKVKTQQQNIFFMGPPLDRANVVDKTSIDQLTVKIKNSDQLKEASNLVSRIMLRRHYNVKDYEIVLPEALLEQKQKTQKIFNVVMGAIAGISLLVGGIGIMNIMLANILERTREIGVRRAVGATKTNILNQFLYEALIISVLGGLIGILIGFIMTSLISTYAGWKTMISTFSVLLAFSVSAAAGLIFGIYPAKKAADKNPIESLRYE
ncbi:MAG TPA: ABC transporter permease [Ignavibacteriaceae bacterium]|nr:ABC transporter permease [Ignavibacteriaceae bacterium]